MKVTRVKQVPQVDKCLTCVLNLNKSRCEEETEKARQLQIEYMKKIEKANEVVSKYTKKLDELEKK